MARSRSRDAEGPEARPGRGIRLWHSLDETNPAMERVLLGVRRHMAGREVASMAESERAVQRYLSAHPLPALPTDPLALAQEFAFRAAEAADGLEAAEWIRAAEKLDPKNPDAVRLRTAGWTAEARRKELEPVVAVGLERLGGPEFLERHRGDCWGIVEARPWLRARHAMARALAECGQEPEALAECEALLALTEGDNQGVRYDAQALLLAMGRSSEWRRLRARYEKDEGAAFLWGDVLVALIEGRPADAEVARRGAARANPHVAGLLLEPWRLPDEDRTGYEVGAASEAAWVAWNVWPAWAACEEALPWLLAATRGIKPPSRRYRNFYESLRPAGNDGVVPRWMPWLFHERGRVPEPLRRAVRHAGARATAWLVAVLERRELRLEGSLGGGWAPAAAACLLEGPGAAAAAPVLVEAIESGQGDDALTEAAVEALRTAGPGALEPGLAALRRSGGDDERSLGRRDRLVEGLAGSCGKDPHVRAAIADMIRRDPGVGAWYAGDSGDPAHLPALLAALDAREISADEPGVVACMDIACLVEAIEGLGGSLSPDQRAKCDAVVALREVAQRIAELPGHGPTRRRVRPEQRPALDLHDFVAEDVPDDVDRAIAKDAPDRALRRFLGPAGETRARPGRNDPCWCGSGKKYKRCHLEADEKARG